MDALFALRLQITFTSLQQHASSLAHIQCSQRCKFCCCLHTEQLKVTKVCQHSVAILQGGLPASDGTRQFAQDLFDKLPGKSSSNGRPPVVPANQRVQDAAARAFVWQNAQYSLLVDDDEDEDAAPDLPAPTTAPLPKKREKKLRKDKAGVRRAAARHCTYWQPWCKHACAHTCGLAGSPYSLAGIYTRAKWKSTHCLAPQGLPACELWLPDSL